MEKSEFIVGEWYKTKLNNYYKFKEFKNYYLYSSEYIYNNKWQNQKTKVREEVGCWCGKADLLEIQEYLPENHPDLIIKYDLINDDMSYLVEFLKSKNIS